MSFVNCSKMYLAKVQKSVMPCELEILVTFAVYSMYLPSIYSKNVVPALGLFSFGKRGPTHANRRNVAHYAELQCCTRTIDFPLPSKCLSQYQPGDHARLNPHDNPAI